MTYKDFLHCLRKVPTTWQPVFGYNPVIRCIISQKQKNPYCCPITAVAFFLNPRSTAAPYSAQRIGRKLGISPLLTAKIISAADYTDTEPGIRADLLRACKLWNPHQI